MGLVCTWSGVNVEMIWFEGQGLLELQFVVGIGQREIELLEDACERDLSLLQC